MLVCEPWIEEQVIADRKARGIDQHDEVWDGVYFVSPIASNEHQDILGGLTVVFRTVVDAAKLGVTFPGVNVSDQEIDWRENFRVPDAAVFLAGNRAENRDSHWYGGPDFAVEIVSPNDRSHEKLAFYAKVGVRELLVIDRDPWALELYRLDHVGRDLVLAGRSTLKDSAQLDSQVLPLAFRLLAGTARPQIEVAHSDGRQTWLI
jgi:Uma2 family endonuclease